jgi:hypothetical protein
MNNIKYNFSICSVFKNEAHILDEWIQHYLNNGVEHIYLVNDNSNDNYLQIIDNYKDKITLYHNDINTKNVGRQIMIYDKYFKPILTENKWLSIIDMDEFLYSPLNIKFVDILNKYNNYSQIKVDWLHFGSNNHIKQPISVVSGFTKRAQYNTNKEYYSYKCIFKTDSLLTFGIHMNNVSGLTIHLKYNDINTPELVINHYNLQSFDFYMNIKSTRGDVNNWFDHNKLKRDQELFTKYDINDVIDLRLYEQNKNNLTNIYSNKISNDDVTLVITSCNRVKLLEMTLQSFVDKNTYPIKETIIIDDSGVIGCNEEVVLKYKDKLNITSLYNKKNIGQIASIDKLYSYVRTKFIFHCEEDWLFMQPSFIEKSMKVFNDNINEKIYTVWLRPHHSTSGHPIIKDSLNRGYYIMKKDFSYVYQNVNYIWGGITFNPGLRKTSDCLKHHPYSLTCEKMYSGNREYIGEYTINKKYREDGYYSVILDEPSGYIDHIGQNMHIKNFWD